MLARAAFIGVLCECVIVLLNCCVYCGNQESLVWESVLQKR